MHRKTRNTIDVTGLIFGCGDPQPASTGKVEEWYLASEAVDYAVRHLSERASTFSLSDLRTTANGYGVG